MRLVGIRAALVSGVWLASLVGSACGAEPSFPANDGFGFKWSDPESARCERVDKAMLESFKHCEFHASGAFGLPLAYHTCTHRSSGETLVFKTAAACEEALETMQANAP